MIKVAWDRVTRAHVSRAIAKYERLPLCRRPSWSEAERL